MSDIISHDWWAPIRVTFDPIQEIEPKLGVGTLSRMGALS